MSFRDTDIAIQAHVSLEIEVFHVKIIFSEHLELEWNCLKWGHFDNLGNDIFVSLAFRGRKFGQ